MKIEKVKLDVILKHKFFLAPFSEDVFWAGATNKWEFSNIFPEEDDVAFLQNEVSKMLQIPHEFIKQLAGIRPTVRDRRPLIGRHPVYPRLLLFNGLGTKGTSLAPYWANHFVDFLKLNAQLSKEVNISRFKIK